MTVAAARMPKAIQKKLIIGERGRPGILAAASGVARRVSTAALSKADGRV